MNLNELRGHHPVFFSGPSWNTKHHPIMFLPHLEDGCLTASPSPVGWSEFHDFRKLPWKMEKKRWMILGNHGDLDGFSGKPSTLEMQSCLERVWYHWKPGRELSDARSYHASDSSGKVFIICCLEVSGYMVGFCSILSSHTMKPLTPTRVRFWSANSGQACKWKTERHQYQPLL